MICRSQLAQFADRCYQVCTSVRTRLLPLCCYLLCSLYSLAFRCCLLGCVLGCRNLERPKHLSYETNVGRIVSSQDVVSAPPSPQSSSVQRDGSFPITNKLDTDKPFVSLALRHHHHHPFQPESHKSTTLVKKASTISSLSICSGPVSRTSSICVDASSRSRPFAWLLGKWCVTQL